MKNKTIVITGASSGFGRAMTDKFASAGASLILVARGREKLQKTVDAANKNGAKAVAVCGDVTDPATFEKILVAAEKLSGRIDVLINNAGGGVKIAPVEEQTKESINQCINLNLVSVINACRIIVPQMKRQRDGLIINITSACAKFAWPGWSVYSAAKTGVYMFSRCLYAEVREAGIKVTVLHPGGSNTGFQQSADIENFDWQDEMSLRPEHIAQAVYSLVEMPQGGVIPELAVYGQAQEIIPF